MGGLGALAALRDDNRPLRRSAVSRCEFHVDGREARSRATADAISQVEEADVAAAVLLAQHKDDPRVKALGTASEVGDQAPLLAISATVLAYGLATGDRRATRAGVGMLSALCMATAIKTTIKHLVSRTRPKVLLEEGHYEVRPLGPSGGAWKSFPSGHTAGSVAVAWAAGRVYPRAGWAFYAGAAAVALVQVPRGAHYPADVAAGALIGTASGAVASSLSQWLVARPDPERLHERD